MNNIYKKILDTVSFFLVVLPFIHLPLVIWQFLEGVTRVSSFTGNPILLSGWLMVSQVVALHYYIKSKDLFFLISFVVSCFIIMLAVTHASFLGILVAIFFYYVGILTLKR